MPVVIWSTSWIKSKSPVTPKVRRPWYEYTPTEVLAPMGNGGA